MAELRQLQRPQGRCLREDIDWDWGIDVRACQCAIAKERDGTNCILTDGVGEQKTVFIPRAVLLTHSTCAASKGGAPCPAVNASGSPCKWQKYLGTVVAASRFPSFQVTCQ